MPLYVIERHFAEQLEVTRESASEVRLINERGPATAGIVVLIILRKDARVARIELLPAAWRDGHLEGPPATEAQWVLRAYPDSATLYFGEHRHADRLRDESAAAVRARSAAYAAFAERAARLDAAALAPEDRTSLRVFTSPAR